VAAAAIAGAAIVAAQVLWPTQVPGNLDLPSLRAGDYFSRAFLERSSEYELFLRVDYLLSVVVLLAALALYAVHGRRFTRESAAGRIGTGMLLGMLAFAIVWMTQLPFGLAQVWWERRHQISKQGYVDFIISSWTGLGSQFLFVCLAILIVMGLAGLTRRSWWLPGAVAFAAVALVSAFLQPWLITDLHPLKNPSVAADARRLAVQEGVPGVPVKVEKVHKYTTAPNAEAVGLDGSRRVILWDTLLNGRFSRRDVRVIVAHELGHLNRHHILKGLGWFTLAAFPTAFLIAVATRRRGGVYHPEVIPLALFVLIAIQVATTPVQNVLSRHVEAEADWVALQNTRDPAAAREAFRRLATTSLSQPNPPGWAHVLFDNHPSIMQRIEMVKAWEERNGGRPPR
jgi:STE24 endopeptidase